MVFSSLVFIFAFLPICWISALVTNKWTNVQNCVLLCLSILFYSQGEPKYVWLFVGTIFINWLLTLASDKIDQKFLRKVLGIIIIISDLSILFWFKYSNWVGEMVGLTIGNKVLPVGISFYTFQAISYVVDVIFMEKYNAEKNPIRVGLYIAFFPQLIAGPIVRYEDMRERILERKITITSFEQGCFRFVFGLFKKVLLADSMAVIANKAFSDGLSLSCSFAWLGGIAYTLQIFMDFSAYSDMAIGLGSMFGFTLPENFLCPYMAKSIREFWRRWHITLSMWFRDYVYIPLGGNRKGDLRTIINVACVWLLTGLWHGANLTFILWGMIHGIFVIGEKAVKDLLKHYNIATLSLNKSGTLVFLSRMYTLLIVILLWIIFRADSISSALTYICRMFRFSAMGLPQTLLYLVEYKWAFIGCGILCFISTNTINKYRIVLWPIMIILFVVCISYLVKGTFSPFLYFNF